MLSIDYCSAFNTILPSKLIIKLEALGLNPALCNWVLDFLTGRPQVGAPTRMRAQPPPVLPVHHDCVTIHASSSIIKFADDTTVVGLITNNDETSYREEARALGVWCQENNLSPNINNSWELIVDFRKQQREHPLSTSTGQQ